jgi:hypothetical protein
MLARVLAFSEASAGGQSAISVGLFATKEHSGHTPELLTPIEEAEPLPLAQDVPRGSSGNLTGDGSPFKKRLQIFRHQQAQPNGSRRAN